VQYVINHLLAILFAAVTPYGNIPTQSIQPLQMLRANAEATICTTWSINEVERFWATAAHCILTQDDEGHVVTRQVRIGGKPTVVMFYNQALDVAVIRAEVSAPALRLGVRPAVGDAVRVYGYMWGSYAPTVFFGRIAGLNIDSGDGRYMIMDMRVGGGHSGSPILDADGNVVSVMQVSALGFSGGALYGYLDELLPFWQD
jgi:hypothetical protein